MLLPQTGLQSESFVALHTLGQHASLPAQLAIVTNEQEKLQLAALPVAV